VRRAVIPAAITFRVRPDITQEEQIEGLPEGTRGGILFHYPFPRDGDYEFQIRLTRDRNEEVEGLHEAHELVVLLDGGEVKTVSPSRRRPAAGIGKKVDAHLKFRLPVKAGQHEAGVTFLKNPSTLLETRRQPYSAHFNMHRHPRLSPAVYQVSVNGPWESTGPGGTPSRRRIFVSMPASPGEEKASARRILTTFARHAFRREVNDDDLRKPTEFFDGTRGRGGI
jgi:hypothetical protein